MKPSSAHTVSVPIRPRVVLVTGVSSGIGRTCAEYLAKQGFLVYGTVRSPTASAPEGVRLLTMDVDRDASVQEAVEELLRDAGRLDVVVNNAGIALAGAIEDTSIEEAKAVMETNLFGAWRVCRAVLPTMRAQRHGFIVNISSIAGILGVPFQGAYSASKFALEGMSESLSAEVGRFGVRVALIEPGDLPTPMTDKRKKAAASGPSSAYHDEMPRAISVMEASEWSGPDPVLVAKTVHRIITTPRPRLRYVVGQPVQRLATIVKRILPDRRFERLVKRDFRMKV